MDIQIVELSRMEMYGVNLLELCFVILFLIGMALWTAGIGMTFYLGRTKMKEIDRLVHGYEITSDSIFYQLLRMPAYGGAFAWRLAAKRAHLLYIRDEFDKQFQRPFIVTFFLFMAGAGVLFVAVLLEKFVLHFT